MRPLAALGATVLMTLLLAGPAAANQKILIEDMSGPYSWEVRVTIADFGWQCSGPLYFGGQGTSTLWLWYASDVAPADLHPDGRAWHWIKGLTVDRGVFYASTGAGRTGKVLSGKVASTTHVSDHHLGGVYPFDVPYPAGVDLETWKETLTGRTLSLYIPGQGVVFHESGSITGTSTVIEQNRQPEGDEVIFEPDGREWRGRQLYDLEGLCAHFGYSLVEP